MQQKDSGASWIVVDPAQTAPVVTMFFKYLCFVLAIVCAECASLPEEKCKIGDNACLKTAFQSYLPTFMEGDSQLGTKILDVLDLDEVDFNISGLQFNLKDGRLKGLKNSIIDGAKFDTKKNQMEVTFRANCTIRGHYKASGRILILPITGDGDMKLKLRNVVVKLIIPYEIVKDAGGKERISTKKYVLDFEVKDGAHFDLTNLFNGNKELSNAMLIFLNQNWQVITVEFGRPMMDAAAKKIYENIGKFLSQMPLEDLFLSS